MPPSRDARPRGMPGSGWSGIGRYGTDFIRLTMIAKDMDMILAFPY
jgi:hypothetical protein